MPSRTERQRRFMGACSNPKSRAKMKGECPPVEVAREFARKPKTKAKTKAKAKKKSK